MNIRAQRVLLVAALVVSQVALVQAEPVSIAKHEFAEQSVEAFAAMVLAKARSREFSTLDPFLNWTWRDFYGHWPPEYPWETVAQAKSDADVYLSPAVKSLVHKDVYRIRYYALTAEGRKRNASLLIVRDDQGFKLAVQANGSDVGNRFVKLGDKAPAVDKSFGAVSATRKPVDDACVLYVLRNGISFRCTYGKEEGILEKLEQKTGDAWTELYLVIFDLEGTPTVKLKVD